MILPLLGYAEHAALWKTGDVLAFEFYTQRYVEHGVRTAFDDGVEDVDDRFCVLGLDFSNEQIHQAISCRQIRKSL